MEQGEGAQFALSGCEPASKTKAGLRAWFTHISDSRLFQNVTGCKNKK